MKIKTYTALFEQLGRTNILLIHINYTKTVERYLHIIAIANITFIFFLILKVNLTGLVRVGTCLKSMHNRPLAWEIMFK